MTRNKRGRKTKAGSRRREWLQAIVLLLFLAFLILFLLGRLRGSLPHAHLPAHRI